MFKLEQLNDLFEFNRSFEESVNQDEKKLIWSNINKCKKEYLQTKERNLLFLIDFYISQWINLNENQIVSNDNTINDTQINQSSNQLAHQLSINYQPNQLAHQLSILSQPIQLLTNEDKERLLTDLFDDLFMNSYDTPKNQWLLIKLMKQFNLNVTEKIDKKINLFITLNECSLNYDTHKLIKYIDNPKDYDENKFLLKLRRLLKENPHLGTLIIHQINDYFELDEQTKLREYSNLNFLIAQSFKDIEEKNFFLICDFLNIIPDNDLRQLDNKLLELFKDYELILNESTDQPHLIERYFTSILGRDTERLALRLSELNWQQKTKSINNILDCIYFILFDHKYLISDIYLKTELINYHQIPDRLKLFYLIDKIYNLEDDNYNDLELFENIIEQFKLTKIDKCDEYVILKLRWIFKFINWIKVKCSKDDKFILKDLLNNTSTLNILLKYNLLPILDEQDEDFSQEVMELIVDCKNKSELMLWKGFIVIRLAMIWLINGKTDEEDLNEIPIQIRNYLKKILPLNFRTELLENLFSLLFLNQDDLILNNSDDDSVSKSSLKSNSLINLTNLIKPNDDLNLKLNKLLDDSDVNKKIDKNTFSFFSTVDNFIFPNEFG